MKKTELRNQIAACRPDFQPLEKRSAIVLKNVHTLETFRQAKAIGAYMPLPDEVDVSPLFQPLKPNRVGGPTFFIPAFDEACGGYRMARYSNNWKNGRFGIPEPAKPIWANSDELDLILVPGVAFDRAGNRLGRGRGFYDRLLPQYSAQRVGICFDFQCLENIPCDPHDCQLDFLVAESTILKFTMNS